MTASRRAVLAAVAGLALGGASLADPARAADRMVDPKKVFPFLDVYLRLPPAKRSAFTVSYRLVKDRPAGMWIVEGEKRSPITIAPDGRLLRLPTATELTSAKILVSGPDKASYGIQLSSAPTATPAAEMEAAPLALALAQAKDGAKSAMGLLAVAASPKAIAFHGVTSGEAVFADGRRVALPVEKDGPRYDPAKLPGVKVLRFPKAPTALEFD